MASSVSGQDDSVKCWAVIGYPSGQDRAIFPAWDKQEKFPRKPYNKFLIDLARSFKMAGYWSRLFVDLDSVSVHKHSKIELGQYPAILTSHSVNIPYVSRTLRLA